MEFGFHKLNPITKFSIEGVKASKIGKCRVKLTNHEHLTREEKNYVTKLCIENGIYGGSSVALMGWLIDFSDILQGFVVKQYGEWHEYWGIDKTSVRKNLYGKIDKIIKID